MKLTSYLFRFKMNKFFSRCSCGNNKSYFDFSVIVLFVYIFGCTISSVCAFNLDLKKAIIQRGETGSMFGYSVAQHLDQNRGWMLVGAPKAQTNLQPGIIKGGAVYRCSIADQSCQVIPFDLRGNDQQYNGTHYIDKEDKSHQWFGATVQSSGINGVTLACAPRYVYKSALLDKVEPVGTCYLGRPLESSFTEYSPCRNSNWGFHRQGFCQAGFSAAMANDGNRLLIGAPGAWYWQGQVYNIFLDKGNQAVSTKEATAQEDDSYRDGRNSSWLQGVNITQSQLSTRTKLATRFLQCFHTREELQTLESYSNVDPQIKDVKDGYSSAVGNFDDDGIQDYVVGVPRAELLKGQITIYTQELRIIRNITGEQIGAYFGYSLAVQDLDGNNLDDIIVGAPLYSNYTSKDSFDTGRVYVYYQNRQREFNPKRRYDILEGQDAKSRFGSALTGLGDINYDGYKDLAVGAPYGGREGKGAVYIYHGSMKGILTQVSQVIHGADFPSVQTFGFSLSGGLDMDRNQYPDLLVGAYESMAAIQLWAKPIVRVAASLQLQPQTIDLEAVKRCPVDWSPKKVLCFNVGTCVKYSGLSVSDRILFDLSWEFDSLKKNNKRIFKAATRKPFEYLIDKELERNKTFCHNTFVFISDDVRDKLTPIEVKFDFKLSKDDSSVLNQGRRRKRQAVNLGLEPVLDQYTPTVVKAEANILKECGDDGKCIPDLSVIPFSLTKVITMGKSTDTIDILVNIRNKGEDAYEARLIVDMPLGIQFNGIRSQYNAPSCEWYGRDNGTYNYLDCDIGNPLPANGQSDFTVRVYPSNIDGSSKDLEFVFTINSTNPERESTPTDPGTLSNNKATIDISLQQAANLAMFGRQLDNLEQVIYNESLVKKYKDSGFGPTVVHVYEVTNLGYSDIKSSLVHIYWPSYDDLGNNLLYLNAVPTVTGIEGVCTEEIYTPANSTQLTQGREDESKGSYDTRTKREAMRLDSTERITCSRQWCSKIICRLQYMKPQERAVITITSRIWTETLVKRGLSKEPFLLVSQAVAQIKEMPYDLPIAKGTFTVIKTEVATYVNAERLVPIPKSIEPWIIGVAIAGGLLLLFLLIVLLWWCGFFRRKRPEEHTASQKPLVYKNGQQTTYTNDFMNRPYE